MPGSTTTKTHTSHSSAHAPAPAPTATAFGVTISTAKHSIEAQTMSKKKKRIILASIFGPIFAFLLWYQYRPAPDPDPQASNPGVQKVVELEKKGDGNGLVQLTRSDDSVVARRAVSALANVGRFDALMDSLRDRRPEIRGAAVLGLANSNDPGKLEALVPYTEDPAPEIRLAAMRGIASTRDFSMFDHLIPMLSDPQPSIRRAALDAIQDRIGLRFPEFDPEASEGDRAKGISRIRATIPRMKQAFDRANQFELRHQK